MRDDSHRCPAHTCFCRRAKTSEPRALKYARSWSPARKSDDQGSTGQEGSALKMQLSDHYRDERLPRYTSYPTAPSFTDEVSAAIHGDWLSSIANTAAGSLYLNVPFCRSMCWYCGCHTTVAQRDAPIPDYLTVLRREIKLVSARLSHPLAVRQRNADQTPEEFSGLVKLLRNNFHIEADAEIAVGYHRIGLDHFALPEDSLVRAQSAGVLHRNFQGYTTDPSDVLLGFGASGNQPSSARLSSK